MALTPEQRARLDELEQKFGGGEKPQKSANIGAFIKEEAPFLTQTVPAVAKGALNKVRESTSQPVLRFLANAGLPSARKEMESIDSFNASHVPSGAEKVGGMAADVGMMMAPTPFGKIKAANNASKMAKAATVLGRSAGIGTQGAVQHQAQNYAKTGEIDPASAVGEVAATTALMGAGSAAAPALKNTAAGYLQLLTRAPKRLERGMNPPTMSGYKQALENKIFPILKGGYKEAEKRGIAVQGARDAEKVGILNASNVRGNAPAAIKEAEMNIAARSGGRKGLLPSQKHEAISQMGEYRGVYRDPYYKADKFGGMAPEKFLDMRKMADQNASFIQGKTPAGLDLASQEFRHAAENQLERKMAKKVGEKSYSKIKGDMAELAPVLEAFNEKAISNYSMAPELLSTLLGVSTGNPMLALAPAIRRVPQVAPAIYEVGRAAGTKTARRAGRLALDLARSSKFSPQE